MQELNMMEVGMVSGGGDANDACVNASIGFYGALGGGVAGAGSFGFGAIAGATFGSAVGGWVGKRLCNMFFN